MNAGSVCAQTDGAEPLLAAISRRIGTQKFNAWFKHGTSVSLEDGHVKVGVWIADPPAHNICLNGYSAADKAKPIVVPLLYGSSETVSTSGD